MTDGQRQTGAEGMLKWIRALPPQWRRRIYWAITFGVFFAALLGPLINWLRNQTKTIERQQNTSIVYMDRLQDLVDRQEDIESRLDRTATKADMARLDAMREHLRDAVRAAQEARRALREHEELAYQRHQELLEVIERKKRRW